jgi:hypothetical protein
MSITNLTHGQHSPPMLLPYFQHIHGVMDVMDMTSFSSFRVPWFGSVRTVFHFDFVISSEINQLEIINQSVLRMFIIALHLCFVYEPYEGLRKFQCCFSVSFHSSNTRSRGCQSYQRSQKNQLPYGTL